MQLQEQIAKVFNGIKYLKYWVVIPPAMVKQLGWKKGQALQGKVKAGKLIIEPVPKTE